MLHREKGLNEGVTKFVYIIIYCIADINRNSDHIIQKTWDKKREMGKNTIFPWGSSSNGNRRRVHASWIKKLVLVRCFVRYLVSLKFHNYFSGWRQSNDLSLQLFLFPVGMNTISIPLREALNLRNRRWGGERVSADLVRPTVTSTGLWENASVVVGSWKYLRGDEVIQPIQRDRTFE